MKQIKLALALLLCSLFTFVCGACNKECAHTYGEWETVVQVTCMADGRLERFCTKCGNVEFSTVTAPGHRFGDWTDGDGVRKRQCTVCGYSETIELNGGSQGGSQSGQGGSQSGTVDAVIATYGSFNMYLDDCEGSRYKGSATRFSVNIGEGTLSPNNYCFNIPEYVSYVKFIGRKQGNPFYNTSFYIESRTSDLEVEFEDVAIETDGTIFISNTRNINVTLVMSGIKCSFLNTSKAGRGADGAENSTGLGTIENGRVGSTGSPTFIVNGHCKLLCRASQLVIKGGEGGDGGNGSWSGMPGKASGNGGDGGTGGVAFKVENSVQVFVKDGSTASISGGAGGSGGSAGGSTAAWSKKYGSNGNRGADGATGCSTPFEKLYD